jgi:hypothetical protein
MAHSAATVIAARTNHAPQLAPVMKSPIALPLHPRSQISLSIIVPSRSFTGRLSFIVAWHKYHKNNFTGRNTLPTESHIDLGNDDPDRVEHLSGDGGRRIGAGLSRTRTGPGFIGAATSKN